MMIPSGVLCGRTLLKCAGAVTNRVQRQIHVFDTVSEVTKRGYDCEVHQVRTEDGYNLTMHRVKPTSAKMCDKLPVMIQHGLSCASTDWVVMNRGLVYRLVDEGRDVWLGNTRGNIYSRSHVSFKPDEPKFWDFSWHEMGFYDLPAMIDYVLKETSKPKMTYIGHSQGTCVFFVMASTRPEYNDKVNSMCALAPVASLGNVGSALLKQLSTRSEAIHQVAKSAGIHCLTMETTDSVSKMIQLLAGKSKTLDSSMTYVLSSLWGYPCDDLRDKLFSLWLGHVRNGLSLKQLAHFAQTISGRLWFHFYDHGPEENVKIYGQTTPPPYPVERISAPVSLFYGNADWLSHPTDVRSLHAALTCDKKLIKMPDEKYNHLDFCWSQSSLDLIVERVLAGV